MYGAASRMRRGRADSGYPQPTLFGMDFATWVATAMRPVKLATMTMPFGGSLSSVEYGTIELPSSGLSGTFDAIATAGRSGVANDPAWSTYQPSSGRKPRPGGP